MGRDRQPAACAGLVLEDVEDAMSCRVEPGEERRPRRPRVRGNARAGHATVAAGDQRCQVRERSGREQRVENLPVGSVPADDEHAGGHGAQDTGIASARHGDPAPDRRDRGRPARGRRGATSPRSRGNSARRCTSTTRRRCAPGRVRTSMRSRAIPGVARAVFACKANVTVAVLREVLAQGLGADAASEGELAAALAAGADPASGDRARQQQVRRRPAGGGGGTAPASWCSTIPASSTSSTAIAAEAGVVQRVLVRVTPGITADTHQKIVTGHSDSKFGFAPADALDALDRAAHPAHLEPAGLHVHLGRRSATCETYHRGGWLAGRADRGITGWGSCPCSTSAAASRSPTPRRTRRPPIATGVAEIAAAVDRAAERARPAAPELILEPGRSIAGPGRRHALHGRGDQAGRVRARSTRRSTAACPTIPGRRSMRPGTRRSSPIGPTPPPRSHLHDRGQALRDRRRPDRGGRASRARTPATSWWCRPPAPTRRAWPRTTTPCRGRPR